MWSPRQMRYSSVREGEVPVFVAESVLAERAIAGSFCCHYASCSEDPMTNTKNPNLVPVSGSSWQLSFSAAQPRTVKWFTAREGGHPLSAVNDE